MNTKLSNNEIQRQLTKEQSDKLKKETEKRIDKTVKK